MVFILDWSDYAPCWSSTHLTHGKRVGRTQGIQIAQRYAHSIEVSPSWNEFFFPCNLLPELLLGGPYYSGRPIKFFFKGQYVKNVWSLEIKFLKFLGGDIQNIYKIKGLSKKFEKLPHTAYTCVRSCLLGMECWWEERWLVRSNKTFISLMVSSGH